MEYNPNIYIPKLKYNPEVIKINDENFITISEYTMRLEEFYDVIFNNNGKEIFIGRYIKLFDNIHAMYNDGKILVYTSKYVPEEKKNFVEKVHTLYDILDDFCYILTEEEALDLFDKNLSKDYLKDKNRKIKRIDVKRIHINKTK